MMRRVMIVDDPTVVQVPVTDVMAGMIWTQFGSELLELRRPGFSSYFVPSLHRPVVRSKRVQ